MKCCHLFRLDLSAIADRLLTHAREQFLAPRHPPANWSLCAARHLGWGAFFPGDRKYDRPLVLQVAWKRVDVLADDQQPSRPNAQGRDSRQPKNCKILLIICDG
jgi:hypothetical protein